MRVRRVETALLYYIEAAGFGGDVGRVVFEIGFDVAPDTALVGYGGGIEIAVGGGRRSGGGRFDDGKGGVAELQSILLRGGWQRSGCGEGEDCEGEEGG